MGIRVNKHTFSLAVEHTFSIAGQNDHRLQGTHCPAECMENDPNQLIENLKLVGAS